MYFSIRDVHYEVEAGAFSIRKMLFDYEVGNLAERQRDKYDTEQPSSILQDIIVPTESPAASYDADNFHQRATDYLRTYMHGGNSAGLLRFIQLWDTYSIPEISRIPVSGSLLAL